MTTRPRGRAGAVALIALAIVAMAQFVAPTNPITVAFAQPGFSLPGLPGVDLGRPRAGVTFYQEYNQTPDGAMVPAGRGGIQVPIVMYHYIRPLPDRAVDPMGYGLSTPPDEFRRQLDWLDQEGYHTVTVAQVREYLDSGRPLPDKPIALTFDDGYLDLYTTAFPLLQAHRMTATAYIVSGFLDSSDRNVSRAQILEMDRAGLEIAAHTRTHPELTKVPGDKLTDEVVSCKRELEHVLGHPVLDFAYPVGRYNSTVVAAVTGAGFQTATTTEPGTLHFAADRYTWTRVRVSGGESLEEFARSVAPTERGVTAPGKEPVRIPRSFPLLVTGPLRELQ